MKSALAALASGALFGAGLIVSGMTKPAKVVGFLDVFGSWDASLAFVMIGAIAVHLVAFRLIRRRSSPLFDVRFHLPTRKDIDARLVVGAVIFGVGWGLGGLCPGPGLVAAAGGVAAAIAFVVGMTVGIKTEHLLARRLAAR
jgi:uncharacterized membrane protein YedE/YeeE